MLFNFQLRSLTDITPWGSPEQPYLHWFGLTDGWFWLHMNESNELFRYSPELLTHWRRSYPEETISSPYVDYQVVRLWEDVLSMLPDILEPLPSRLVHMLETEEQASLWEQQVERWEGEIEEDELWDTYWEATGWWGVRQLDTGYLRSGPRLWLWNDGEWIHCFWDNNRVSLEGLPAWEAQQGQLLLTPTQFLEEVHFFHTRLFLAMQERIQELKNPGLLPAITLDLVALEKEQQDRSQWLTRRLEQAVSKPLLPWNTVIDTIMMLEKRFRSPSKEM